VEKQNPATKITFLFYFQGLGQQRLTTSINGTSLKLDLGLSETNALNLFGA
jgi:hypothetical protein